MSKEGYQKYFRAIIQNLGQDFGKELDNNGKHVRICDAEAGRSPDEGSAMTRKEYLDKIVKLMKRSRGRELPGMFNPLIVADLFREQSSPWGDLARAHIKNVWDSAREFLRHVIMHTANLTTADTLQEFLLMPKLEDIFKELNEKVEVLLSQHHEGHPITYNESFIDTLQQIRMERQTAEILGILKSIFHVQETLLNRASMPSIVDLRNVARSLAKPPESGMSHFAAQDVLDTLESYYKV